MAGGVRLSAGRPGARPEQPGVLFAVDEPPEGGSAAGLVDRIRSWGAVTDFMQAFCAESPANPYSFAVRWGCARAEASEEPWTPQQFPLRPRTEPSSGGRVLSASQASGRASRRGHLMDSLKEENRRLRAEIGRLNDASALADVELKRQSFRVAPPRSRPAGEGGEEVEPASGDDSDDSFVEDRDFSFRSPPVDDLEQSSVPVEFRDVNGEYWYRTKKQLGTGANGVVWLGMAESGGLAALKMVKARSDTLAERQELRDEVCLMEQFRHDNIVRVLGHAEVGAEMVLAMEYISGGSLDALLSVSPQQRLPFSNVGNYCDDVVHGLVYLHQNHITHGDLKPGNILLTIEGRCRLADFGAAARLASRFGGYFGTNEDIEQKVAAGEKERGSSLMEGPDAGKRTAIRKWHLANDLVAAQTRLQQLSAASREQPLVGTPAYIAPEACRRQPKQVSDYWSLGITLCQLLAGQLPYKDDDAQALHGCWRLGHDSSFGPTVDEDALRTGDRDEWNDHCVDFVRRCLTRDYKARMGSVEAVQHPYVVLHGRTRGARPLPPSPAQ
eukprot:TRINITY_DN4321_c0_g1_i1.p1 TRINITY_DN4321_c0_g1~~TRINITY_DN4321_c0_g1_i1.p1  ORF type:complete len:571 (+),score=195.17 TRINITY_DN4321_c0_g1_i1:48-1715(+)